MRKEMFAKLGLLLILFCLICFLVYQEYQGYQNLFGSNSVDFKTEELAEFKNVKVHKNILSQITRMSKSAGRDLVELTIRYGYLDDLAILELKESCYKGFSKGYSLEFASNNVEHKEKMRAWLEENAYKYGFVSEVSVNSSHLIYTYVGVEQAEIKEKERA